MLDHMTFRVSDIKRTKEFYHGVLSTLGYQVSLEGHYEGTNYLGFSYPDETQPDGQKSDVWFVDGPSPYGSPPTIGCHLAWKAASRAQVDAFYEAALKAGAKDHGAPGLRPHYHPNYYGAFVIDLEGNNIEAVCHLPE